MQQNNWHDIYTQLSPKLLGICRRYIKDIATAEDIVQDSFIVAIQKESNLKNKEAVNGWLSRIVINRAINHLKNENKISYSSTQDLEFVDETTMPNTLELDKKSAILASNFSQEDLLEAIDSLPENHKSVFNLYIIDQFSHLEISNLLKISVGTSKSSLSRARKSIQEILTQKLNGNTTDEKKKRRIALLLFLGFGNQMFANYFRKSFSTFEIKPKHSLDLSRKTESPVIDFAAKPLNVFPFFKAGVFVFGLSITLFYFMKNEKAVVSNERETISNEIVTSIDLKDSTKIEVLKVNPVAESKKEIVEGIVVEKNTKPQPKSNILIPEKLIEKDTVTKQEPQKVVVIKKQIVKKDTVYVTK